MEVITKDEIQRAWDAMLDRLELYHYLMWKLEKENENDGYERIH